MAMKSVLNSINESVCIKNFDIVHEACRLNVSLQEFAQNFTVAFHQPVIDGRLPDLRIYSRLCLEKHAAKFVTIVEPCKPLVSTTKAFGKTRVLIFNKMRF